MNSREAELSLFADKMILYDENPEDSTKTTVGTDKFSKVAE